MYHENEIINEWVKMLLESNGVAEIKELTAEMIDEEVDNTLCTARNEHLWALGAPTSEASEMHKDNEETLKEYAEILRQLNGNRSA